MTVCKRIGAWLLTLVLLVSALPYTAFAASEDSHVVNATMEETSVEDIASNVTTQLLRGAKSKNETLSMEAKPTHEDTVILWRSLWWWMTPWPSLRLRPR